MDPEDGCLTAYDVDDDGTTAFTSFGLTLIAGGTAFAAAVNWSTLPLSPEGLRPGSLFDTGGVPGIVESDKRRAKIKQMQQSH